MGFLYYSLQVSREHPAVDKAIAINAHSCPITLILREVKLLSHSQILDRIKLQARPTAQT